VSNSKIIGIGSPVVDILARVPESFIDQIEGAKGGMVLVDAPALDGMIAQLPEPPAQMPGGSSGNTTFAMAELGVKTTFLGKIGNDDYGRFYRDALAKAGGDTSRFCVGNVPNGRCLSLITPDSERTMRTDLGAAMTLSPEEIEKSAFEGIPFAHIEGYLLFNRELLRKVLDCAKAAGCKISLDLASFEVVNASRDILPDILRNDIDMVFANEDEAAAFFEEEPNAGDHARRLSKYCPMVAVKEGKKGSWIAQGDELIQVNPITGVKAVDTTGAGDYWAAGFLLGMIRELPLAQCGAMGSRMGAEIVQHIGAKLPGNIWQKLRTEWS
jgi:sugar/nucleoside kinase (ribokinase family)